MAKSTENATRKPASAGEDKFWRDLHHSATRRSAPRVHANVPVCLSPDNSAAPLEMLSNDLSCHGMQLRCDRATAAQLRPQPKGRNAHPVHPVTLQLEIDGLSLRVTAHVRVAHVTLVPDADTDHEVAIGFMFVNFGEGAEQAMQRFVEQHLLPAGWP